MFCLLGGICFSQNEESIQKIEKALDYIDSKMYAKPDSALIVCNQALKIAKPNSKSYAKLLARRGVIYDLKGETEKAVEGLLDAIQIQKSLKDSVELSYSYNNLGIAYFYTYRYAEALKYYNISAEIDSLQHDFQGWAGTQINRAIIFSNQNEIKKAASIYEMILEKSALLDDETLIATIYSNQAKLMVLNEDYKGALEHLEKARPIILLSEDPSSKMTLEVSASTAEFLSGNYDEALLAARRGLSYDPDSVYTERRIHLYECLAHVFYAQNKLDSGEFYNSRYQGLRDSLFNLETQEMVEEVQVKYEVASYKLEEERLKSIAALEAKESSESRAQRNLFIAIALIFFLIVTILYYRNRTKKKEQIILEEKLNLQEQLVKQKEDFIGEIHHRVKNNLQIVASMLAIQRSQTEDENIKSVFESSKNRIEAMSLIHDKLYQSTDFHQVNIQEYIDNLANQLVNAYSGALQIEVKLEIEEIILHIDSVVPVGLMINELITNSIKYAFEFQAIPQIIISIIEKEGKLNLTYKDNGQGLKAGSIAGFGSHLLRSLARQMKAESSDNSDNGYCYKMLISKYKRIR